MTASAVAADPRLVHRACGRVRVHLPGWTGAAQATLEARVCREPGIRKVRANSLTGNILVHFDPELTDDLRVLSMLRSTRLFAEAHPARASDDGHRDVAVLAGRQRSSRRVRADVVSEAARTTPHAAKSEMVPPGALRTDDLRRSATRTAGAALGLAMLFGRRLAGAGGPPVTSGAPAVVAGTISLIQSFPALREKAHERLGPEAAEVLFDVASIVSLTLAGGTFGLLLNGLTAGRLLSTAIAGRAARRRFEEKLEQGPAPVPGAIIRLETGERLPLPGTIADGVTTWIGVDGLPVAVEPGGRIPAGQLLLSGPCAVTLARPLRNALPAPRPLPPPEPRYDRYRRTSGWVSLAYGGVTAVASRSLERTFAALLLVNPRAALTGEDAADSGALARVLRAGVTVVDPGAKHLMRLPDAIVLGSPRLLASGIELHAAVPVSGTDAAEVTALAAAVAAAAEAPWSAAFRNVARTAVSVEDGHFDGVVGSATRDGVRYTLRAARESDRIAASIRLQHREDQLLVLRRVGQRRPLGVLAIRPRISERATDLVRTCGERGVQLALLAAGDSAAAQGVAARAGIALAPDPDAVSVICRWQAEGQRVAFVADTPDAAPAFAAADLAIAVNRGRSPFAAGVDLLAPDLGAVACIVEAAARRDLAARDSVGLSALANVVGAVWGLRGQPPMALATLPVNTAALTALAAGWARLRGGERATSVVGETADPRPERWGRQSAEEVLRVFETTDMGLSSVSAAARLKVIPLARRPNPLLVAALDQIKSPLTAILAAGAGLSLFLGSPADAVMIAAMLVANAAAGVWQELRTGQAADALEQMSAPTARVLRDGHPSSLPAGEIVPGDALLLARGDRVAADARLIAAHRLEVDEASLTGESLPVSKTLVGAREADRVVLAGSDVTLGTGQAVVTAVGPDTLMGAAIAAMAAGSPSRQTPLTTRLHQMLRQVLPIAGAGGGIVAVSGLLRREPALPSLALGATAALAAVPEGLPLLASLGEAAVARRLAARNAIVRRPSAVEALGRVDTVCADKTGTMTEGRLALALIADAERELRLPGDLPPELQLVLVTAALAGPHPDAPDADVDPTDAVVARAADTAGLGDAVRAARAADLPFESARLFHASIVENRLCAEGAAEALAPLCDRVRRGGVDHFLDDAGREALLDRAQQLAAQGLRVLMVAEGAAQVPLQEPHSLVALGFLGLADPLRAGVLNAVRRCHAAGIRVIMITGDHPATARAIGRDAGLVDDEGLVLTGADIVNLEERELDMMLEQATIIARATPVDKVRIVESLQRRGHTVAMTGDGVNDAPALRLADVGVAMGRGGTEVARQAADVVLTDDDFATLVEAFVEGRTFWRNIRRSLGLLLGGNLGELGLVVGASLLRLASPLTGRQILMMNLMTDVLPALAVVLARPKHHDLAALAREGASALGKPLRNEVFARGGATAVPSLVIYLIALRAKGAAVAQTVAFASIVSTQLAQTLDAGSKEGDAGPSIHRVVAGTAGVLAAMLILPAFRAFAGLVAPTPLGWGLIGASTLTSVMLARTFAVDPVFNAVGPTPLKEMAESVPGRGADGPTRTEAKNL
ncbi:MAG: HAD-IC family P-type ATPase [Gemmatimonadaceae bacterium]